VGTVGTWQSVQSACPHGGRQLPSAGRGTWRNWRVGTNAIGLSIKQAL
jgi:hypothetical protein